MSVKLSGGVHKHGQEHISYRRFFGKIHFESCRTTCAVKLVTIRILYLIFRLTISYISTEVDLSAYGVC